MIVVKSGGWVSGRSSSEQTPSIYTFSNLVYESFQGDTSSVILSVLAASQLVGVAQLDPQSFTAYIGRNSRTQGSTDYPWHNSDRGGGLANSAIAAPQ